MNGYELYINNQRVEIFEDESLSLNQTIQDVRDVSKVFTDFSKPFNLPASKENNKIFKHYYRFNLATGTSFDARKKVPARIELNTIPFKEGLLRLEGVSIENNQPKSYKVTFFGNTVTLKDTLREDEINSLNWLDNFNTTYSASQVLNLLTTEDGLGGTSGVTVDDLGTNVTYYKSVICPLISNSARLYMDGGITVPYQNADGSENLELGGNLAPTNAGSETAADVHGVYFEDLTYAIPVHLIVRAIQNQYTSIRFSDDFFSLTNGPEGYKKLYMLCQNTEGRQFEDMGTALKQVSGFSTAQALNNKLAVTFNAIYIQGLPERDFITGVFSFQATSAYPDFTIRVRRGGTSEVFSQNFTGGTNTTGSFTVFMYNTSAGYTIEIETTTAFQLSNFTFQASDSSGNSSSHQLTNVIIPLEKEFIIKDHLPSLKTIDFISGLFKMFNLTAFEKDGIIHVKTLEEFYNSGSIRDITEFVDPSSSEIDKALPYEEIIFKYKDTDTRLAKQHSQLSGSDWGSLKYNNSELLDSNNKVFNVELPFAHLKYEKLLNGSNETEVQVGWMANENGEPYFEDAVLFIPIFQQSANDIRFLEQKTGTGGINDFGEFWMPSNSVSIQPEVNKENIHFNLELNEFTNSTAFDQTLFLKYYRFYIQSVFNRSKRLTRLNARLPKKFILNYSLADSVTINNESYKINSITTNLLSGESQMQLLNETVDVIPSINPDTGGGDTTQPEGTPETNVLYFEDCANSGTFYESSSTIANFNFVNNRRLTEGGNFYIVKGNIGPGTYTAKTVSDTGFSGCPESTTPPTLYYGLKRCSDNESTFRTSTAVTNPTYAITEKVEDSNNVAYVIINSNTTTSTIVNNTSGQPTVVSAKTVSAFSPKVYNCTQGPTTYYYSLTRCDGTGTVLYGFSGTSGLSGSRTYNNTCYNIASTTNTGTIDVSSLPTCTCPVYYYTLNSCSNTSSIQHYGFSNLSNLAGTERTYNGTCYYVAATSNTTGSINIGALSTCTCPSGGGTPDPIRYSLKLCSNNQTGYVSPETTDQIDLDIDANGQTGSRVQDANGFIYTVIGTTTNTNGIVAALVDLGSNGCPTATPTPTDFYWLMQKCTTSVGGYVSEQTTAELTGMTEDPVNGSRVQGPDGEVYIVYGNTDTPNNFSSGVISVVSLSATGCPTTIQPNDIYYWELKQCSTNNTGFISAQTTEQLSALAVGDFVFETATPSQIYEVTGTTQSGTSVGSVTKSTLTACPLYWSLKQCGTLQGGYRSGNTTVELPNLVENDPNGTRVQDSNGIFYIVVGTTNSTANVGTVTDTGATGCPTTPPVVNYYSLQKCDDGTTGWRSQQDNTQITFNTNDIVSFGNGGTTYKVVGLVTSGNNAGPMSPTSFTSCPTTPPPTPPVAPQGPYYAQFITCDDPNGQILYVVSQTLQISSWWVIQRGGTTGYECLRWVTNLENAVNPQDITNFTIFSTATTAGENCIECNENAPTPPTPPATPPPTPICGSQSLFYASTAPDLCNQTTPRTVYIDANTIEQANTVYTNSSCNTVLNVARYFADQPAGNYYYWSGTNLQGPYTNSCQSQ